MGDVLLRELRIHHVRWIHLPADFSATGIRLLDNGVDVDGLGRRDALGLIREHSPVRVDVEIVRHHRRQRIVRVFVVGQVRLHRRGRQVVHDHRDLAVVELQLLCGCVGDHRNVHTGEIRLGAPVVTERGQRVMRPDLGIGERVRAGAEVMGSQVGLRVIGPGVPLKSCRAHHAGAVRRRHVVQKRRIGPLQRDGDLVIPVSGNRVDVCHHVRRPLIDYQPPVERRLDRGRREGCSVVELHPLTQVKGEDPVVGRLGPSCGQQRLQFGILGRRLELQQAFVQVCGQQQTLSGVKDVGIRRLTRILQERHMQHLVGGCRVGRTARA